MSENSSPVDVFVPMDRRVALARGETLPNQSKGAVLFADVSGFTRMTAVFYQTLGYEWGAEELTRRLNQVFEVLIARVHYYGGSVIIFSGDAITCWFEGDNGRRATACGLEMQAQMGQFERMTALDGSEYSVALKVAVTVGRTNRFLVGHTHIQRLEVLAGATLDRAAAAEQLLHQGETIVGAEVLAWFGSELRVTAWRSNERGENFAVVDQMTADVPPAAWPAVSLAPQLGREWVIPPIAERVLRGEGEFLAQIRVSVALFLRFGGINYDEDPEAGAKLDVYIRWVQTILAAYEGHLLELTIGDKGSYLYCVFGTPLTHENDPARSISAAIELQSPPPGMAFIGPVQIGVSQGVMRAGSYGSSSRRSYGVQGKEVNIAARLMSKAQPGQILVSSRIVKAVENQFDFKSLGLLELKGFQEPIPVYSVLGERLQTAAVDRSKSPLASLVGREQETAVFLEQMAQLKSGRGGTIIVEGDSGIGKSRLVTEFLLETEHQGIPSFVGAGNEVTQSTAYFACRSIFHELFGLEAEDDIEKAWGRIIGWLDLESDDEALQRLPLLSVVLPFHIPDSELTYQMRGELRANNTTDLLLLVLKKAAEKEPIVVVIEDGHWLDEATWILLERLKWETVPLLLVIAIRPIRGLATKDEIAIHYERVLAAPDTRLILLKSMSLEQTVRLVCRRLGTNALPESVGELIHARTDGHPFFSEELAVTLRDTGLLQIKDGRCQLTTSLDELYNVSFPNTIQKVITSRIDRLTPAQQLTLKVASVAGRAFNYRLLFDVYPIAADRPELESHLARLEALEIIQPQEHEWGGMDGAAHRGYVFANGIIRESAYNQLLFEQRRQLHKAIGEWYEERYKEDLTDHFAVLAHHLQKSDAPVRALPYLANAGKEALKNGAYKEAVGFFSRLIEIVENDPESWQVVEPGLSKEAQLAIWHRQLGESYSSIGETTKTIEHAKEALALLGKPVPASSAGLLLSSLMGTAIQFAHILWPGRFIGRQADDIISLERGRAFLTLQEASFFKEEFLASFQAGMHSLNYLEETAVGSLELFQALSDFIVGMTTLPGNIFASRYVRLSREALAKTDSLEAEALFQFRLGIYYFGIGRWQDADRLHREAVENYRQLGHLRLMVECLTNHASFLYYQGKFNQLDGMGQEVYRLASRQGSVQQMVWGMNLMGASRLKTADDPGQAMAYMETGAELVGGEMEGISRDLHLGWLAEVYLKMGQVEQALETAAEIMAIQGRSPVLWGMKLQVYCAPALIYLTLWEQGEDNLGRPARDACRLMGRYVRVFEIGRPRLYLYWGWYHWLAGRKWLARFYWRRSLAKAQTLEMAYEEGLACMELGRHLPAGEPERQRLLARAVEIFEELGAIWDLKRVRGITNNE